MGRDADFTLFVAGSYRSLTRTAYLLTGDRGHAEDLVQTCLLKTYLAWQRISPGNAEAYTRTVLVRQAVRWKARRWSGELPSADPPELSAPDTGDGLASALTALRALPAGQRAVLVLRYLDDLSEAQTAAVLGISVGTVKSRSSRGLAALRSSEALHG